MTADERAAKLWEDLDMMYDTDDGIEGEKRDIARIAAAIRAAVQEAYERAAKLCDLHAEHCMKWMGEDQDEDVDDQWDARHSTCIYLAANIRELE